MRLEPIAPHVAEKIRAADSKQRRDSVLSACRFAVNAVHVNMPLVAEALLALEMGLVLSDEKIAGLNDLVQQFDERYFDLQEQSGDDPSTQIEALSYFGKARALSALLFSQNPDALVAAMESVYEASATTAQPADLFEAVMRLLS